mmetsp:Transcript_83741/g.234631  ORF Transcript_83741/g.234631 Transcript_83741/m.234631 type:complete len:388 (+) Transcript_83741:475-1638(+)
MGQAAEVVEEHLKKKRTCRSLLTVNNVITVGCSDVHLGGRGLRLLVPLRNVGLRRRVVVGRLAVLVQIQGTVDLRPDGNDKVDQAEEHVGHHEGVHRAEDRGHDLLAELLPRACDRAGVDAVGRGVRRHGAVGAVRDRPQEDGAHEAAHAVHAPDIQGIVEAEDLPELAAAVAEQRGHHAQHKRSPRLNEARRRRHGRQARDGANAEAHEARPAETDPVDHEPEEQRHGGRDLRVHCCGHGDAARGQRGASVEAEPSEPEQRRAQGDEGHVVRQGVLLVLLRAFAHQQEARKRREARGDVHHDAAREVLHAPLGQEAAAPDPVAPGRIDEDEPEGDEEQVGFEAEAIREAPRHQRGGDHREHALVCCEQQAWDLPHDDLPVNHQLLR